MTLAAERDVVSKLARGSFLSRLRHPPQPLKLAAVPRDYVRGDRGPRRALLAGRFTVGGETLYSTSLRSAQPARSRQAITGLLPAARPCRGRLAEKGAKLAEAVVGRWLLAHGRRRRPCLGAAFVGGGAHPILDGPRALNIVERLFFLSFGSCSTRSRAAPATSISTFSVRPRCLGTARRGLFRRRPARPGRGAACCSRRRGLARALASAHIDDGGLISRSPYEQRLLSNRFGLLRGCYMAAKQVMPEGIEAAAQASLAALHWAS